MTTGAEPPGGSASRFGARKALFALASVVLAPVSMAWLLFFLWQGARLGLDLDLPVSAALALDLALSFVFFLQHSLMVRRGVRERMARFLGARAHGAAYSAASGAALLVVLALWQHTPVVLYDIDGLPRLGLRVLFVLALAFGAWAALLLWPLDTLGLRQLRAGGSRSEAVSGELSATGPYALVRHPLYTLMLVLLWCAPTLTVDRLLMNVAWSAWIVVATRWEERDLVEDFGDAYREYQRRVPQLVPFLRWPGER